MPKEYKVEFKKSGKTVTVKENENILDAGLKAGIPLPYGCKTGVCATCSQKVKGTVFMTNNNRVIEADNNYVFICVACPRSDVTVQA